MATPDTDLAGFVRARLDEGKGLGSEGLRAARAILAAYAEVAYMDIADPEPEYAYGRAEGLGEAVRHIAAIWSDHPHYQASWALPKEATDGT